MVKAVGADCFLFKKKAALQLGSFKYRSTCILFRKHSQLKNRY